MNELGRILKYEELTTEDLDRLDRDTTVLLMAVSPMEAHGPHLPIGTDLFVAESIRDRYADLILDGYPGHTPVVMPSLAVGADTLARTGSLQSPARVLENLLVAHARSLASSGFRFLFIADNHGGPRHLLAFEAAARLMHRRHRFHLVNPFTREFALMMSGDQRLRDAGLGSGTCGDLDDVHAGTNETSLMLALHPEKVDSDHRQMPRNRPPSPGILFAAAARLLEILGARELAREVRDVGAISAWSGSREMAAYIGAPGRASASRGERMLRVRLEIAGEFFEQALADEPVPTRPPLWPLRLLRFLP